ncbi:MAG TPA: M28 family peptidase [Sphingomicrobium sp.]|nr:M28 family peptidase [Sphingomicrobium sp.]
MRIFHCLSAGALGLAAIAAAAQPAPSFDFGRIDRDIQILSSDEFEGRAPATRGEQMTVDYLVKQLQEAGVQPGGEVVDGQRQWTQRVPLYKSDFEAPPRIAITYGGKARTLTQSEEIALMPPVNGRKQVALDEVPLVFAGYGVTAPERGWDDFKDVDVRGKMLVVLINDPDFEGGEGDFGGKAMTYYGRWTYKNEEAARRGAAGIMIVHEAEPASYGWNTVANSFPAANFDIVREDPAARHTGFESWIQRDLAKQIFQAAGLNFEEAKAAARRKDFRPVDLNSTLSAKVDATTEVITSYNVAGMLPGTQRPDETVIYTAHHDHLGIGEPDESGDRIFNGAADNATGTAHVLEQARAFAQAPRTERSIVFLLVGAEEKGLLGSEYYVANPLYPLERTVAVLNTDLMGVNGPAWDFSISGIARLDLLDMLIAEGARRGRRFTPDPQPEAGRFFRSDHFPFAKAGVPAISYKPGHDLVNGRLERGSALDEEYTSERYHQQDDEYDADWDLTGIARDAELLFALGYSLANGNAWPNWSEDSEFRAARDRSSDQRQLTVPAEGDGD